MEGTRHPNDSDCSDTDRRAGPKGSRRMERNVCENKAVAILNKMQQGKNDSHQERRGRNAFVIVLDKPLSEAQALVETPMPLCLKLRKSSKISMRILLSHKCSTLMCAMIGSVRMCPCPNRKPKQPYRNDESSAASNSTVNVGYPHWHV